MPHLCTQMHSQASRAVAQDRAGCRSEESLLKATDTLRSSQSFLLLVTTVQRQLGLEIIFKI